MGVRPAMRRPSLSSSWSIHGLSGALDEVVCPPKDHHGVVCVRGPWRVSQARNCAHRRYGRTLGPRRRRIPKRNVDFMDQGEDAHIRISSIDPRPRINSKAQCYKATVAGYLLEDRSDRHPDVRLREFSGRCRPSLASRPRAGASASRSPARRVPRRPSCGPRPWGSSVSGSYASERRRRGRGSDSRDRSTDTDRLSACGPKGRWFVPVAHPSRRVLCRQAAQRPGGR